VVAERTLISGARPAGYQSGDAEIVRIPYAATPEDHADVRRKLAAGWKLGEIYGEQNSLFKYASVYPPTPRPPTD
jgi:hypothetical protein